MASVKFYLLNSNKDGKPVNRELSIYMDFIITREERLRFKLDEKIHPSKWDKKRQEAKRNVELNLELQRLKSGVLEVYRKQKYNGLEAIKFGVEEVVLPTQKVKISFFEEMDRFIEMKRRNEKKRTHQYYKTTRNDLLEYSSLFNVTITFNRITPAFLEAFQTYLIEKPLLNITVKKKMSSLKTFMRHTYRNGLHNNQKFEAFKIVKGYENQIITLTQTEVVQFMHHEFKFKRHERVRDLWLFAYSTVQRWSDVEMFDKNDIRDNVWDFHSHKTNDHIRVPLFGFGALAKQILEKYHYKLPVISNQKFNKYLKEAAQEAGINSQVKLIRFSGKKKKVDRGEKWEFLSSHSARRTGVTVLLERGVPGAVIQQLTGHDDLRTLSKYENIQYEALEDAYRKVGVADMPLMKVEKAG